MGKRKEGRKEGGREIRKKEGISRLFMLLEIHLPAILHQSMSSPPALLQEYFPDYLIPFSLPCTHLYLWHIALQVIFH